MNDELLTQIENDLLAEIRKEIGNKDGGDDLISGMYSMNIIAESIADYKEKLLSQKEALGLTTAEIDDLLEEASLNIVPRILA